MDDTFARFWTDMAGRLTGPMTFRFILQPAMASLSALRDGVRDARNGRPPYFWGLFTHPDERRSMLREGWTSIGRVIGLGVVMDAIYQLITVAWIYPVELLLIVFLLAILPYLLLRGTVNRIARARMHAHKVPAGPLPPR